MFTTCADEEPVLGFTIPPSITFVEATGVGKFVPTANTCICSLVLPHATHLIPLPEPTILYNQGRSQRGGGARGGGRPPIVRETIFLKR